MLADAALAFMLTDGNNSVLFVGCGASYLVSLWVSFWATNVGKATHRRQLTAR